MGTEALGQLTYLPDESDAVASVLGLLASQEEKPGRQPLPLDLLAGPDPEDRVELPATVYRLLLHVLQSLEAGKAVTVAPQNQLLTTQQAAELLGVSRPTVVKLIERGDLPARTPGTRRRLIELEDVLACRRRRREAQYRALLLTSVEDFDADEIDGELIAKQLRQIRADIAAKRTDGLER